MRKPALSAALLLSILAIAGCGSSADKDAYVQSVSRVQQQTQTDAKTLSDKMQTAKTPAQIADNLSQLGRNIEKNASSLKAIKAPDDVKTQHEEYVKLMNDFGKKLESLATDVRTATPGNVKDVLTKASRATTDLSTEEQKVVSEINSALQG